MAPVLDASEPLLWVEPRTFPADADHRAHMMTWCNGTALASDGVGPSPYTGGHLHFMHMLGYCKARAPGHLYTDELWAGPVEVTVVFTLIFLIFLTCLSCFAWICMCRLYTCVYACCRKGKELV